MARRKNGFLSDGSDSGESGAGGSDGGYNSQEDGDSRAERALFEHNGNKRRKRGDRSGKDSAWEGIFGEEEDDNRSRGNGSRRGGKGAGSTRTDWTKAPTFVTKSTNVAAEHISGVDSPSEQQSSERQSREPESIESSSSDGEGDSSESDEPAKGSPRRRDAEDDEEDPPRRGMGLGFGRKSAPGSEADQKDGGLAGGKDSRLSSLARSFHDDTQSPRGSTPSDATPHGGLGSSNAPPRTMATTSMADAVPSSFGRPPPSLTASSGSSKPRQSFMGRASPMVTAQPAAELTASERAHFSSISGSFGAKFLSKLGWEAGKGLGAQEDGRAVPVAAGPIMRGKGITSGIRTEDSKREARRKGEKFSDDEEEKPSRNRRGRAIGQPKAAPAEQSWKKQKKLKVKVEHKTYEQLLAEAGDQSGNGIGLVLDARGGDLKEVSSLSALSLNTWTPTNEDMQLPELRHNLRLIVDIAKGDVDSLAREGKNVNERRKWATREEQTARRKIEETKREISRLRRIQEVVSTISTLAAEEGARVHPTLASLAPSFDTLLQDFQDEYLEHSLDDVIVGAIEQVMRKSFVTWQPFDVASDLLLSQLKPWRRAFHLPRVEDRGAMSVRDAATSVPVADHSNRYMTAWEALLWSQWLPKVRSTLNNEWDATSPSQAVHLLEAWDPILPPFIRDNVLDQLVLPKMKKAIDEWDARVSRSGKKPKPLATIVFPWLPLLGDRVEEVLEGAKRRIRAVLRSWSVKDAVPDELSRWKKDVYSSSEWDKLVLQNVVPKLGVCLREDFSVNPANQDMRPINDWVMPWHSLLRSSVFSHLLEVEFFPKWLNTLYLWLVHPGYKPDEVANWFIWWKDQFPAPVRDMRGIAHGFSQALELMNEAMRLGPDAPSRLRKPNFQPLRSSKAAGKRTKTMDKRIPGQEVTDITFRSLVEDHVAQHDLIFVPLGRSDIQTGKPLFRVSKGIDGKKGVTVYVGDAAVFAQSEDGTFRALSLEDMTRRAQM